MEHKPIRYKKLARVLAEYDENVMNFFRIAKQLKEVNPKLNIDRLFKEWLE